MAITISKLYVKAFEDRIRNIAQQSDSRLRPWVVEKGGVGATNTWPKMGTQAMTTKTGRTASTANTDAGSGVGLKTPIFDSQFTNRMASLATYHGGDAIEAEDVNQILADPNSAIAYAFGAAARRKVDEIIIAAATGNAYDETGGTVALPASSSLYGAGSYSGVTTPPEIDFSQVTLANEYFLSQNVPPEEEKVFVVGPKQARKLLHLAQATQTWYVEAKQLVAGGFIRNWMGFTWIVSNLLTLTPNGAGVADDTMTCFAMTRRAMGLFVSKDVWVRVAEDPSISFATRIYTAMTMGAVRIQDEQILKAEFNNNATVSG